MLTTVLLIRIPVRKNREIRFVGIAAFIVLGVIVPQLGDMALEAYHIQGSVQNATGLSVNRMAQVMQRQIETVVERGVDYGQITGLNTFFRESADRIEAVELFGLGTNNVVYARASGAYVDKLSKGAWDSFAALLRYESAWAGGIFAAALLCRQIGKRHRRNNQNACTIERHKAG
jgi:hypothetical protein